MADIDIASPGASAAALRAALLADLLPYEISGADPGTAPGAGKLRWAVAAGTTPGTAMLLLYAGTSTTPVILADDIGSGF